MPVPTETLRNMKVLNLVFAASSVALLMTVMGLILEDSNREWRQFQRDGQAWRAVLFEGQRLQAEEATRRDSISQLEAELARLNERLLAERHPELASGAGETRSGPRTIAEAEALIAATEGEIKKIKLAADVEKGKINPLLQQIEKADLTGAAPAADSLRVQLKRVQDDFDRLNSRIVEHAQLIAALKGGLRAVREARKDLERDKGDLERQIDDARRKLDEARPQGVKLVGEKLRNAPGLDWVNPSEKPLQTVTRQVLTDYNFVQVETIDRCQSCHINIDNPLFDPLEIERFAERQVAAATQGDVSAVAPVVLLDFWENVADHIGHPVERELAKLEMDVLAMVEQRREAAKSPGADPTSARQAVRAAQSEPGTPAVPRTAWYHIVNAYDRQLRRIVTDHVRKAHGQDAAKQLQTLYRYTLLAQYNRQRAQAGLPPLSDSPVLLAHPGVKDLYAGPDSKHPMATMACTSCHEGSGQETHFEHTAHTPREMWVDAQTGAPVPDFLVRSDAAHKPMLVADAAHAHPPKGGVGPGGAVGSPAHASPAHSTTTHQDVNLIHAANPAPFAPARLDRHAKEAWYADPASPDQARRALRQQDYWKKRFHWATVHYMHWEKPMHSQTFIESSCIKCHTEVYDLRDAAPRLFEGRKLFAELGCVNCHGVDQIASGADLRKVGPSLVHVKDKLSADMIANWVWSPKAFRPLTKMPHVFLLENNSSPVDVLRSRVEVMAIAWYLKRAQSTPALQYWGHANRVDAQVKAMSEAQALSQKLTDERKKLLADAGKADAAGKAAAQARAGEIEAQLAAMDKQVAQARAALLAEKEAVKKTLGPEAEGVEDVNALLASLWARVPQYQPEVMPDPGARLASVQAALPEAEKKAKDAKTKVEASVLARELHNLRAALERWTQRPGGDVERGRTLFKKVGCTACHVNLNESGESLAVPHLAGDTRFDRRGLIESLHQDPKPATVETLATRLSQATNRLIEGQVLPEAVVARLRGELKQRITQDLLKQSPVAPSDTLAAILCERGLLDQWSKAFATGLYNALNYNQRHVYILTHLDDQIVRVGPELSGVGSKLLAGRPVQLGTDGKPLRDAAGRATPTAESLAAAGRWLYDWLRNPRAYHGETIMPSLRLSQEESLDLVAYLLDQRRPGFDGQGADTPDYQPAPFGFAVAQKTADGKTTVEESPALGRGRDTLGNAVLEDPLKHDMLRELVLAQIAGKITRPIAEARLLNDKVSPADVEEEGYFPEAATGKRKWSTDYMLFYLGKRMIQHYGCNGCHSINGFESTGSACAKLDEWGLKDPHKLAFGYYEHAFDSIREQPTEVWKARHEGQGADTPTLGVRLGKDGLEVDPRLARIPVEWETIANERRSWLYHKLHNPRVYDRGLGSLEGQIRADDTGRTQIDIGRPYDKLKMPKFFLKDSQALALVTFVTGVRKALVAPELQNPGGTDARLQLHGRQLASLLACNECHSIDGNTPSIWRQFDAWQPDGTVNLANLWPVAPPRLMGQGAKTNPQWLVEFLHNVHRIRPTPAQGARLEIRMPSFALSNQQASQLVDYFAGWSRSQSRKLEGLLEPIHLYRDRRAARKGALETRIAELKNQQALARAAMSHARDLLKAASPASGDPAAAISRQDAEIQRLQKLIDRTLAEYEGVNGFDNEWFNVPLRQPGELPPALEGFQPRLTVATEAFRRFCYQWKLVNPGALDPLGGAMPPVFDLSKPEGLKARDKWRSEQRKLWEDLFRQVEFLSEQLRTDYPFHSPREAPEVSPERFYRGQVLFEQMKCTQCHAQGDEAKLHALWMKQNPDLEAPMPAPAGAAASVEDEFGDDKPKAKAPLEPVPPAGPPYQAPNLHHIARRLQRKWVDHWLQQPNYFVPGITMPAQWPNGDSVWLTAEGDVKDAMHKRFGHTGPEQRELMLDYLYAAARRNYTPLEELLLGRQPMQTPLPDLAPPVVQGPARVALQLADLGGGAEQQVDFKALSEPEKLEYLMDKGKEIYSQLCINCHQATGMGVAGQFPPLNGSEWVLGEHTRRAQLIVLHGAQGPITVKGQKWTPPQPMPAGGGRPLTNEQIAAVLTYVRNNWDNKAPAIYPDEVAATRKKYPRNVPWTEAELLQIVNEPQTVQQPVEPPKPSDAPKPAEPAKP